MHNMLTWTSGRRGEEEEGEEEVEVEDSWVGSEGDKGACERTRRRLVGPRMAFLDKMKRTLRGIF